MVDVYVGAHRRHWCLHRNLLCHHSEYFSTALGGDQKPNPRQLKLELLDDDAAAFEYLVKWLYQGQIDDVTDLPLEKKWDHADTCQKLYLLCDRVKIPHLKNIAMDQFRKGCNEAGLVPGAEEMKPIYDKTQAGSPFRKLVSKIAARQIMDPDSDKDASTYRDVFLGNPDFAIDVINAIKSGTGGKLFDDPTEGDHCIYHQHENGDKCKKKVGFKTGFRSPRPRSPMVNGYAEEPPKVNGMNGVNGHPSHNDTNDTNDVKSTATVNGINGHKSQQELNGVNSTNGINGITKSTHLKNGTKSSDVKTDPPTEVGLPAHSKPQKRLSRTISNPMPG